MVLEVGGKMEASWRKKKEEFPLEMVDLNQGSIRGGREGDDDQEESLLELRLGPPGKMTEGGRSSGPVRKVEKQNWPRVLLPFPSFFSPQRGGESEQGAEKKAFSFAAHTAVFSSREKRMSSSSVVGWPPICSTRRNLNLATMATSRKQQPNSNNVFGLERPNKLRYRGSFVKINMDGVPIGRKLDLKAYDSYEKLASAIDELFRCLVAAQRHCCASTKGMKEMGLLDRDVGEYTLVYEDNEGDRMLVGDVPWHMFVLTAKRLRVLKSSAIVDWSGLRSNFLSHVSDANQGPPHHHTS